LQVSQNCRLCWSCSLKEPVPSVAHLHVGPP
jgi:hypothetical protein